MRAADGTPREAATSLVLNALRRITRALRLAAERTHAATGLSAAQLFVLRELRDGRGRSLTELARATLTDRTSVAAVVERLSAGGLVERGRSEVDRRRAEVRITAEGWRCQASAPAAPTTLLIAGLEELPDAALIQLGVGMDRLAEAMGLEGEPAEMLFEEAGVAAPAVRAR